MIIFLSALLLLQALSSTADQLGVEGFLKCGDAPASNVRVKLWDGDDEKTDNMLAAGFSSSTGHFLLNAEFSSTEDSHPVLKIHHDCNDGVKVGQRKMKFAFPRRYIAVGDEKQEIYNFGTFNLEVKLKSQESRVDVITRRRRHRRGKGIPPESSDSIEARLEPW